MELLQWDFHVTFSRQEECDGKLPSSDTEQCIRMGVFRQEEFDGKLPSSDIEQCLRMGVFCQA